MSREIKFRAWYPGDKSMHVISFADLAELQFWCSLHEHDDFEKHPERLMQFTGLCDKNGKEVYESDIGKCDNGYTGVIIRDRYMFIVKGYQNSCHDTPYDAFESDNFEIIGNIYENPELLEGAK